ncbi:MAG: RidA family protein [Planctomycetes bacterium]|nr:RidA family protein [Planctomycetota bacterium]
MSAAASRRVIAPAGAAANTGAYSPGLVVGNLVFVSGQGPLDPVSGSIVGATIEEQTELTLRNVGAILAAAGASLADVVKSTVHIADMAQWSRFDAVYRRSFAAPFPTRTTVQSVLWGGILVEIDVIAVIDRGTGKDL